MSVHLYANLWHLWYYKGVRGVGKAYAVQIQQALCDQIDGMLACQTFYSRNLSSEGLRDAWCIGWNVYDGNLFPIPYIIIIRAVQHNLHLAGFLAIGGEVQADLRSLPDALNGHDVEGLVPAGSSRGRNYMPYWRNGVWW